MAQTGGGGRAWEMGILLCKPVRIGAHVRVALCKYGRHARDRLVDARGVKGWHCAHCAHCGRIVRMKGTLCAWECVDARARTWKFAWR
eukprot:355665-Chlamydomonas_euryale.AAC.1